MTAAVAPAASARPRGRQLATGELLAWALAFFVAVALAYAGRLWLAHSEIQGRAFNAVKAMAWICALLLIRRDDARTRAATPKQIAVVAALVAGAALAPSRSGELALIPLGLFVMRGASWSADQRRAGAIFAAIGTQHLFASFVPILFGPLILPLDTAAAGLLMQAFVPGTEWAGNILKPPGGVGVTVYMGCSSFANLSYVALCFAVLTIFDGARWTRRAALVAAGTGLLVIVLNTARLVVTAQSLDSYIYWHNGFGAQLFGVVMTFLTIALCSLGSRWAAECR